MTATNRQNPPSYYNYTVSELLDSLEQSVQRYNINVESNVRGIEVDQEIFWDTDNDVYLDGTFGEVNSTILNSLD
jgi:hypothetical protein